MALTNVYSALKRMRELSNDNVPFSISFVSYNSTKQTTKGIKHIKRALLRTGLSQTKSDKSEYLIAYYDLDKDKNGFAYLPLILTFNNTKLK